MSTMRVGIVVFPGSNGDHDALYSLGEVLGQRAELVWHTTTDLSRYDLVVLPGGFSYGDHLRAGAIARFAPAMEAVRRYDLVVLPGGFSYGDHLRAGAIARFAPAMEAVRRYAEDGGWVLGICNGFQVLTESHMLPGALMRNAELSFTCRWVHVRVEESRSSLLGTASLGTIWRLPIAHGEGRYFAGPDALAALEANGQIVLRYCDPDGTLDPSHNPNGSSNGIAGICNAEGNVLGLMPHPERAAEAILGGDDGRLFLQSVIEAWQDRSATRTAANLEAATSAS